VTNVTNFGAFVDIGVHQDGLVHISALSKIFVKDPHSVIKTGDVVKVKVMEVDEKRKRIALTMRLDDVPGKPEERKVAPKATGPTSYTTSGKPGTQAAGNKMGSLGNLLQDAFKKK
jgi:protein Tex